MKRVGLLCLQGAVQDHGKPLARLGAETAEVRRPADLRGLDGLIIPGGESTVMARFLADYGLVEPIIGLGAEGFPIWGICAGAIVLCAEVDGKPGSLRLLALRATRNAYGRQLSSFEEEIETPVGPFPGIFIRAPRLEVLSGEGAGESPGAVEAIGWRRNGEAREAVLLRRGAILAASFHPELSGDDRLHAFFLSLC